MGKLTGFLEFERKIPKRLPVAERLKNWHEFERKLDDGELAKQGGRCMDCGIPFCHKGCPLGNIIPDWNDFMYLDSWKQAHRPPALDQQLPGVHRTRVPGAVRRGLHAQHQQRAGHHQADREADRRQGLRASGCVKPEPPECKTGKRVAVVGSGPAGLAARSSWRAPATTSRCSSATTASAACCATASRTSRWRST